MRLTGTPERPFIALANAYDEGFATCWPAGSRLLLDRVAAPGPGPLDLRALFASAAARFLRDAVTLLPQFDEQWPLDPSGALMLATGHGDVVDVAWIGAARALQVRADELVAWTTPHTMREQSAAQVPATEVASLPTVLVRSIRETPAVPELASFRLERGDRLLFVQGSGFEADANAYARAARAASAEQAATEAVALGSGQEVFVSAVCLERA